MEIAETAREGKEWKGLALYLRGVVKKF